MIFNGVLIDIVLNLINFFVDISLVYDLNLYFFVID